MWIGTLKYEQHLKYVSNPFEHRKIGSIGKLWIKNGLMRVRGWAAYLNPLSVGVLRSLVENYNFLENSHSYANLE